MQLEPRERAELAERLLESLDQLSPAEIEELWLDEAERRSKEWDQGRVSGIPAEQVFDRLKNPG